MQYVLKDLLTAAADGAPALSAPGRAPLSFGALRTLIGDTLAALSGTIFGREVVPEVCSTIEMSSGCA